MKKAGIRSLDNLLREKIKEEIEKIDTLSKHKDKML